MFFNFIFTENRTVSIEEKSMETSIRFCSTLYRWMLKIIIKEDEAKKAYSLTGSALRSSSTKNDVFCVLRYIVLQWGTIEQVH